MRWKIWCESDGYENLNAGWSVSNGITSYTAKTEQEANWLKDQLNRAAEPTVLVGSTELATLLTESADTMETLWCCVTPMLKDTGYVQSPDGLVAAVYTGDGR